MTDETVETAKWHERTVERSLRTARERAISRGDRFVEAAAELLRTTGKADTTVQEIVDRSGMSLRSFYHHFGSKDDLLLALIEESVRRHLAQVRPLVEAADDPVEQLRLVLETSFGTEETADPASRGLVLFHWHLANTRTEEFTATLEPNVELLSGILERGVALGRFRTDISVPALASLLTTTMFSLIDLRVMGVRLTDEELTAEDLVAWCLAAVAPPG